MCANKCIYKRKLFQINIKQLEDETLNDVLDRHEHPKQVHKIRHNKMLHSQMSRLARALDQLEEYQQSLQTELLDIQRRTNRLEEPNWNLLSAKVDLLELENKVARDHIKNISQKVSDFDKLHASLLELREDIESIENKADKTIPEFRKEISKLDINFAQVCTTYLSTNYTKDKCKICSLIKASHVIIIIGEYLGKAVNQIL